MEPFLHELETLKPSNALYHKWWSYALSLSRDDVLLIIENGLTYQANSLKSMVKELAAGQSVPPTLAKKLDLITSATAKTAYRLK